ncbi:MAG: alpha/beta fold hydrolase [Geminicoccaceae bacterium]
MFEGFEQRDIETGETVIHARTGGSGPPLLLLHGYPQTHVTWHLVAPVLAEHFTVVCADLRGYGDSGKPESDADHLVYSKRKTALDMVEIMTALGFERFMVAGHDRGGRVAHRMALDHAKQVEKVAFLDIVPTRTIFQATNQAIATGYYHWFFLIQPNGLPERLIGGDPIFYLQSKLSHWGKGGLEVFASEALEEYERCFKNPDVIHASCEDYRAGASIDLIHDEADIDDKIQCPVHALWGLHGMMERHFDVIACWKERSASDVTGMVLPCGHFLPEEEPNGTADELLAFFKS